jgi:hypothetical protein
VSLNLPLQFYHIPNLISKICMLFTPCIFLQYLFLKANEMHQLKYNKIDHKTHFIPGAIPYLFWHQGDIISLILLHQHYHTRTSLLYYTFVAVTLPVKLWSILLRMFVHTAQEVVRLWMCKRGGLWRCGSVDAAMWLCNLEFEHFKTFHLHDGMWVSNGLKY